MTRFLKVSLSVVALLLVSLLVFTGCSNKEAGEALTAAEEAMQAVTEATADFEAAIANKADAGELADEVENLTKAIEEAELVAADSDAALKTAIAAARAALTENTQAVVKALDVKIAQLLAEKADSVVIDAELARFETILRNINNATGAYLKLNDFVSFSTQAGVCAYELEQNFARMAELENLYGDNWAKIEKAYTVAKVTIYRATSMAVINAAIAEFEKVVSENPNDIDDFYYNTFAKYEGGNAKDLYDEAKALYDNAITGAEKAAVADYYGKGNLVLASLELWREELTAEMIAIGKLYIVGNAADVDRIGEAEAEKAAFVAAVTACNDAFDEDSDALDVPATYTESVARLAVMENAANDAAAVIALNTPCASELEQDNVNDISEWKEEYDEWVRTYLPELQNYQKNDAECVARYNEVKALIAPTEADLNTAVEALKALAKDFIDGANAAFINNMKANFYTGAALDLNRVTILSGDAVNALANAAEAWAAENDETLVLPAFVYTDANAVHINVAYQNVVAIKNDYAQKLESFTNVYTANKAASQAALSAGHLNMYDTISAGNIIAAFGDLAWGEVTYITLSNDEQFTKAEYTQLVALETERLAFVADAKAHNEAITAAYNALMAVDDYAAFGDAKARFEDLYSTYLDGMYAGAELATYCAYNNASEYEDFNDENGLTPTVPADYVAQITLHEKYLAVKHNYELFKELEEQDAPDPTEYASVKAGLQNLLNEYTALQGHDADFAEEVQNFIDDARDVI